MSNETNKLINWRKNKHAEEIVEVVTTEAFKAAVEIGTIFSSNDDSRPILTGIDFDLQREGLRIRATDSYSAVQVFVGDWRDTPDNESMAFLIDPRGIDLRKLVSVRKCPPHVTFTIEEGVEVGFTRFETIFGDFPRIEQFFDEANREETGSSFAVGGPFTKGMAGLMKALDGAPLQVYPPHDELKPLLVRSSMKGLRVEAVFMPIRMK